MSASATREYATIAKDLEVARAELKGDEKMVKSAETKIKTLAKKKEVTLATTNNPLFVITEHSNQEKEEKFVLKLRKDQVEKDVAKVRQLEEELKKAKKPKKVKDTHEMEIERPALKQKGYMNATVSSGSKTKSAVPKEKTVAQPARQAKQLTVKQALKAVEVIYENLKTAESKRFPGAIAKWRKQYKTAVEDLETAHAAEGTIVDLKSLGGKATPTELKAAVTSSKRQVAAKKRKMTDDDDDETSGPAKKAKMDTTTSPAPPAKSEEATLARGQKRKREEEAAAAGAAKKAKQDTLAAAISGDTRQRTPTRRALRASRSAGPLTTDDMAKIRASQANGGMRASKHHFRLDGSSSGAESRSQTPLDSGRVDDPSGTSSSSEQDAGTDVAARKRPAAGDDAEAPKHQHATQKLKGLFNHQLACFSNVAIQIFDAATEGHDLDTLLGAVENVESFGLTPEEGTKFNKNEKKALKTVFNKQAEIRSAVRQAAGAGEHEKVSATKHLRALLDELHKQSQDGDDEVSPYLFQTVLAWGAAEDAKGAPKELSTRQTLSGDTQEDSFEYFQVLLDVLSDEPSAHNASGIKELFNIETEMKDVCSKKCGYESDARPATSNYISITVPASSEDDKPVPLERLVRRALRSHTDRTCERCEAPLVQATTFVKAPQTLVVKVDRAKYHKVAKKHYKTKVEVELFNSAGISIKGEEYKLAAVVMHDGRTVDRGHYKVFRRHGGSWYLLDDEAVSESSEEMVKDDKRGCQSAMLLLKKA